MLILNTLSVRVNPFPRQRGGGERQAEAGAAPRLALDLDAAAVLCDDLADDDEAEPRPAPRRLRRVERVEDVRAHLLAHPLARVGEVHADEARCLAVAVAGRAGSLDAQLA